MRLNNFKNVNLIKVYSYFNINHLLSYKVNFKFPGERLVALVASLKISGCIHIHDATMREREYVQVRYSSRNRLPKWEVEGGHH